MNAVQSFANLLSRAHGSTGNALSAVAGHLDDVVNRAVATTILDWSDPEAAVVDYEELEAGAADAWAAARAFIETLPGLEGGEAPPEPSPE